MSRLISTVAASAAVALGALLAMPAMASSYGTVVSRTAVYAQVLTPQRQCTEQQQLVQPASTGAGGLLGALVGGVAGNAFGHGGGRALATGAGVIGGALLGDRIEANATPPARVPVQQCQTVSQPESRLIGFDVVYRYNGQDYSTRLASDPGAPGAALPLNVNVSPSAMAPVVQSAPVVIDTSPAVVYGPPVEVYGAPVYAAPTVGLRLGAGWGGGYHHWR